MMKQVKMFCILLVTMIVLGYLVYPNTIYADATYLIQSILNSKHSKTKSTNIIYEILDGHQKIKMVTKTELKKKPETTITYGDNDAYIKGIDVSKWNGEVDWTAVKEHNIKFVIFRAGYGQRANSDIYFHHNIKGAIDNNMIIGIYWFSYAYTNKMADIEAKKCLETIRPYKDHIILPIFYDFEYDSVDYAKRNGVYISKTKSSKMADIFCKRITKNGYRAGIYTNLDYANNYFTRNILNKYHTWIAQWDNVCTYKHEYIIWQCTDRYYINNKKFDLNYFYYNRYGGR